MNFYHLIITRVVRTILRYFKTEYDTVLVLIADIEEGASESHNKGTVSNRSIVDKSEAAVQDERFELNSSCCVSTALHDR